MDKIDWDGPVSVCERRELDGYTRQGWKVLGSYQDVLLEETGDMEPLPPGVPKSRDFVPQSPSTFGHHGNQSYYGHQMSPEGFVSVRKLKPVSVTFFVIGKDQESVIGDLHRQLQEAKDKLSKSLEEQSRLTEVDKKSGEKLAGLETDKKRLHEVVNVQKEQIERMRETSRKFEADIGKIRQAVGDLRMKDILG